MDVWNNRCVMLWHVAGGRGEVRINALQAGSNYAINRWQWLSSRDGTGSYGTASKYNVDPVRLWKVYNGIVLIHGNDALNTGSVQDGQWLSVQQEEMDAVQLESTSSLLEL